MLKPDRIFNEKAFRSFGGLGCMGKTVASYRIALEWEISHWKQFRNAMSSEEQKQAFDGVGKADNRSIRCWNGQVMTWRQIK
jgi:hypothetical protein